MITIPRTLLEAMETALLSSQTPAPNGAIVDLILAIREAKEFADAAVSQPQV